MLNVFISLNLSTFLNPHCSPFPKEIGLDHAMGVDYELFQEFVDVEGVQCELYLD